MKAYLAQIDGWSGTTATSLTLASHDDESLCHLNGQTWLPAIERLPVMRYDFFDGDFSGQIVAPTGAMVVRTEGLAGFAALALHDARIRIWQGDLGAAWGGFTLIIDGRIEQQPDIADGVAQIGIGVDDSWLDKPFLALYSGAGGIEGGVDLKGSAKPRLFGAPRFVDAVLVDAVNNVWQLSDGAINQVELAFDRLSRFGASAGDHASFAALVAAGISPGSWATCLASGLVRFGAPGEGLLAFHARGDSGGTGGWVRKPGAIIGRIAEIMGASAKVNAASLTALDAARLWNISLAVREQTTPRELILSIAQSVVATPVIDWLGQLHVLPVPVPESATSAGTLAADGTALPPVASVAQQPISPPFWRVAQQAEVTQRVHADSEIASIDFATAAEVNAAQTTANTAMAALTEIASDSLLTPDEKPRVIQDRDAIVAEQAGIDAQASTFGVTTERTAYNNAVSALTTYLATLTSPVLWSNLTGNTTIVGSTFRQKFIDVYTTRQALLNKITEKARMIAVTGTLTNEFDGVAASSAGVVGSFAGTGGQFLVYEGSTYIGSGVTFSVASSSGVTISINPTTGVYAPTAMSADTGTATLRAVYNGVTVDKIYSITKVKAGPAGADGSDGIDGSPGANAKTLTLISDRQVISYDAAGAPAPTTQTTTFSPNKQNTSAAVTYSITDANGVARAPVSTYLTAAGGDVVTMTEAQFASARNGTSGVIVTATITDGTTFSDKISVVRVQAGATGATGAPAVGFVQDSPTPSATFISQTWYKPTAKEWYYATATGTGGWQRLLGDMSALSQNTLGAVVHASGYMNRNAYTGTEYINDNPASGTISPDFASYTLIPQSALSTIQVTIFGAISDVTDNTTFTFYGQLFVNGSPVGYESFLQAGREGAFSFQNRLTGLSGSQTISARLRKTAPDHFYFGPTVDCNILIEEFVR